MKMENKFLCGALHRSNEFLALFSCNEERFRSKIDIFFWSNFSFKWNFEYAFHGLSGKKEKRQWHAFKIPYQFNFPMNCCFQSTKYFYSHIFWKYSQIIKHPSHFLPVYGFFMHVITWLFFSIFHRVICSRYIWLEALSLYHLLDICSIKLPMESNFSILLYN